jgi:hypothetical protein
MQSEDKLPHPSHSPKRDTFGAILFTVMLVGAGLYYFFRNPAESGGIGLVCPTNYLTSLHCPACGSQRAMHALLHGHFLEALSFNIFAVFILFPALGYMALVHGLRLWGIYKLPELPLHRVTLLPLAFMAITFAILRNLPFAPFDWLAP